MHRLTVALLSAFDAAIAAAVGIAATLAPLTVLWVFGLGDRADWRALWPTAAKIWQLGHLVPLRIELPGRYLAVTGIDQSAASFVLSLAPLAFAAFTVIFAARSGGRASGADAWITGVVTGSIVFAAFVFLVAVTSRTAIAEVTLWQALLYPALLFALPAVAGAVVTEWRDAGRGAIARLRDRTEALRGGWGVVPGLSIRAGLAAVAGLVGLGAVALAVAIVAKAGDIVALYQTGNFDLLGAIAITLAQLAYLPTAVVWGLSFIAGPGFALGTGTAVSPAGTQLGVVPAVPLLGAIPQSSTTWLLLLVLLPIGVGALAGWIARSRFIGVFAPARPVAVTKPVVTTTATDAGGLVDARRAGLAGLMTPGSFGAAPHPAASEATASASASAGPAVPEPVDIAEPFLPRLVLTVAIAAIAAGAAALFAAAASGSAGPGRLSQVGPEPGPVALAVGLEVVLGAGILLLAGRPGSRTRSHTAGTRDAAGAPDAAAAIDETDAAASPGAESAVLASALWPPRWPKPDAAPAPLPAADVAPSPGQGAAPTLGAAPGPGPAAVPIPDAASRPGPAAVPIPDAPPGPGPAAVPTHDPDADTAPIPLPPHPARPDQAMPAQQDDSGDSGL